MVVGESKAGRLLVDQRDLPLLFLSC